MLTDGLEWCGLLWCFYQLFGLSFWRHPFTAEDPLVSNWCNATFLQIWWRNKLIYIFDGLRTSKFSAYVQFWVNYSSNKLDSYLIRENTRSVNRPTPPEVTAEIYLIFIYTVRDVLYISKCLITVIFNNYKKNLRPIAVRMLVTYENASEWEMTEDVMLVALMQ